MPDSKNYYADAPDDIGRVEFPKVVLKAAVAAFNKTYRLSAYAYLFAPELLGSGA